MSSNEWWALGVALLNVFALGVSVGFYITRRF